MKAPPLSIPIAHDPAVRRSFDVRIIIAWPCGVGKSWLASALGQKKACRKDISIRNHRMIQNAYRIELTGEARRKKRPLRVERDGACRTARSIVVQAAIMSYGEAPLSTNACLCNHHEWRGKIALARMAAPHERPSRTLPISTEESFRTVQGPSCLHVRSGRRSDGRASRCRAWHRRSGPRGSCRRRPWTESGRPRDGCGP